VAEKTGSAHSWQPMLGAASARRSLLGDLLRLRRAALGYRHVPAFVRDRDINSRLVGDIEHGRRDTFTFPTLEDVAAAYEVTYGSMMAVVWSDADELVPAEPAPAEDATAPVARVPDENPPMSPAQAAADRPYYDPVNERRFALAAEGILDPTGEQMFGAGTEDARAWDGPFGRSLPIGDRCWFIAELHRLEHDRRAGPNSGTGTTGALSRSNIAGLGVM
jgi:hypothetical protein